MATNYFCTAACIISLREQINSIPVFISRRKKVALDFAQANVIWKERLNIYVSINYLSSILPLL